MSFLERLLAYWGSICPVCNFARKHPNSFIGRIAKAHWDSGCKSHKAYLKHFSEGTNEPQRR